MLFEKLLQHSERDKIIENHRLGGYLFFHHRDDEGISAQLVGKWEKCWKEQWLANTLMQNELGRLGCLFELHSLEIVILKGLAIIEDVYDDLGSRFMSDIDLLIEHQKIDEVKKILLKDGYALIHMGQWYGDQYKMVLIKSVNDREIVLELHTSLFYHIRPFMHYAKKPWRDSKSISRLDNEVELVHLIGHLAQGHTFLKLLWLIDIDALLRKRTYSCEKLYILLKEFKLVRSGRMVFFCLKEFFRNPYVEEFCKVLRVEDNYLWKKYLTEDFLFNPSKNIFNYYIIKHFTKDSLMLSLKYTLLWCFNFLCKWYRKKI